MCVMSLIKFFGVMIIAFQASHPVVCVYVCETFEGDKTWLMIYMSHMDDMTHSYVRYDSTTCMTWLIEM